MADAAGFVSGTPLGTRIVVRRRIEGGFTDAIGYLRSVDDASCVVETRHGTVTILLADIALAKAVPPPPARRARRVGTD
ncbi:ferrous iron transport protein A [Cryobacterium tagatosivorans]|uniref:Ferrous iron transport protein A n=1 Tax=Cryobacterium tagatosivorans TaxID=1259199 RepID=A0A4R8UBT3_9MICO|nr:ferrous iron transport protein A [Cryobacterium tagatosivorans]TFB47309.1 ferrous iron transport protein A [Cryobacterium tagatosivorans]